MFPRRAASLDAMMDGLGSDIWSEVVSAFRQRRGQRAHDLWLGRARPCSLRRGLLTLEVEDAGAKSVLDERYRGDLEELIQGITGSPVRVRTRVAGQETPAGPPLVEPDTPARCSIHGNFVVTGSNRLAHAAVERVVSSGEGFNPLFVHGPPGCGKTALAAHALQRLAGDEEPLVLSGEALAIDVGRAAREGTFGRLQKGWSGRKLIVLDEAHRLRNKDTTQSIVVSLIAPAVQRGARVLVFSRHAPDGIYALGDRLRSHFLSGFVVAMKEPDTDAREAVLAGVVDELKTTCAPEVPGEIARRCPGTLVDAVAVLRRAASGVRSGRLSVEDLGERLVAPTRSELLIGQLVDLVAKETGLEAERIRSREKSRPVALARHLCVYVASRSLGLSTRQICRSLHQSSPSIVAYARRKVELRRASDAVFDDLIHTIQSRIEGAQRDLPWRA